ncbi:MAG TPA: hypothetical protein VEA69_16915 [Tepidisphaeraceae bacterium]|nr:hypothetical protein [Tepidisphaeraceae bacterium]
MSLKKHKRKRLRTAALSIPVFPDFKQRVERLAAADPTKPTPTHLSRLILEEGVERREKMAAQASA